MNTPLPMVVIGYQLSQADFRRALCFWGQLLGVGGTAAGDFAAAGAGGMYADAAGLRRDAGGGHCGQHASGGAAGMFAAKFDRDVSLAPSLVAVQMLLSMITMPLVLGLAKFLV